MTESGKKLRAGSSTRRTWREWTTTGVCLMSLSFRSTHFCSSASAWPKVTSCDLKPIFAPSKKGVREYRQTLSKISALTYWEFEWTRAKSVFEGRRTAVIRAPAAIEAVPDRSRCSQLSKDGNSAGWPYRGRSLEMSANFTDTNGPTAELGLARGI
ncbi:hypothetical protein L596_005443 [Steinernema carpocapsae]|uniref:Uncharacterized protein n=1 Tax=Steinernema carpocapsae TaxID=34508 RepID=A0A4U8UZ49_STECR|nr:hypothetical protein L596_005443 [Steinernema carpocapsae]